MNLNYFNIYFFLISNSSSYESISINFPVRVYKARQETLTLAKPYQIKENKYMSERADLHFLSGVVHSCCVFFHKCIFSSIHWTWEETRSYILRIRQNYCQPLQKAFSQKRLFWVFILILSHPANPNCH